MSVTIDFNQLARIGKLIALLGFFLPWVTVSCASTDILTATGWQLMTGDPQLAGPLAGMAEGQQAQQQEDAEPNMLTIAAFATIAVGLLLALATRARTAAIVMLIAALTGAGLSYYSIENMRQEMRRELASQQESQPAAQDNPFFGVEQQRQMSQAMSSSIRVVEEEGYFLTLVALALSALFALLTRFTRRTEADASPAPS